VAALTQQAYLRGVVFIDPSKILEVLIHAEPATANDASEFRAAPDLSTYFGWDMTAEPLAIDMRVHEGILHGRTFSGKQPPTGDVLGGPCRPKEGIIALATQD
jgi:hypothetical protein